MSILSVLSTQGIFMSASLRLSGFSSAPRTLVPSKQNLFLLLSLALALLLLTCAPSAFAQSTPIGMLKGICAVGKEINGAFVTLVMFLILIFGAFMLWKNPDNAVMQYVMGPITIVSLIGGADGLIGLIFGRSVSAVLAGC
jgi:hypothetical protein